MSNIQQRILQTMPELDIDETCMILRCIDKILQLEDSTNEYAVVKRGLEIAGLKDDEYTASIIMGLADILPEETYTDCGGFLFRTFASDESIEANVLYRLKQLSYNFTGLDREAICTHIKRYEVNCQDEKFDVFLNVERYDCKLQFYKFYTLIAPYISDSPFRYVIKAADGQ